MLIIAFTTAAFTACSKEKLLGQPYPLLQEVKESVSARKPTTVNVLLRLFFISMLIFCSKQHEQSVNGIYCGNIFVLQLFLQITSKNGCKQN